MHSTSSRITFNQMAVTPDRAIKLENSEIFIHCIHEVS